MFDNFIEANTKKVNYNTLVEQKPKTQQTIKLLKISFKMQLFFITFKFDFGKMFKVVGCSYDTS